MKQYILSIEMTRPSIKLLKWMLASENQRFRDTTQGKDGALHVITDQERL